MLRRKPRSIRIKWELYYAKTKKSLPNFKYYARTVTNGFVTLKGAEEWARALDPTDNYIRVRKKQA
jgi:hypothetical protein